MRSLYRTLILILGAACAAGTAGAVKAPTIAELQANPELLKQQYDIEDSLTVEEYYFRGYLKPGEKQPDFPPQAFYNEDLYVVRNGKDVLYVKKQAFRNPRITFEPLDAGAPVVCLPDPSGGNGWRANPSFVVLRDPLKLLGQVSGVDDLDGDGERELVVVDDVWEGGLSYLSHAGAPGAAVVLCVENEKLVLDRAKTSDWAWKQLSLLNKRIAELQPAATSAMTAIATQTQTTTRTFA